MPEPVDARIDAEAVRRLAALNGLHLEPKRAAVLVPFVTGLAAADARLAALDLGTLPAAGLPWEPFTDLLAPASDNHESAGACDRQ